MQVIALRLVPGQDLKLKILEAIKQHEIQAGIVLSSVGSLKNAALRYADSQTACELQGPFEIINLNGTLAVNGVHLHISISDKDGKLTAGHLLEGCKIHTTCELVLGIFSNFNFSRENDLTTNYKELVVKKIKL